MHIYIYTYIYACILFVCVCVRVCVRVCVCAPHLFLRDFVGRLEFLENIDKYQNKIIFK